ncbi:CotH protein [Pirellulimonas nuda]|uniref:CotH protein n=1 Tax=Pirellulimonas nuda TaxID=2528009 RepID=A0A518DBT0_9BACT|nr:chitobiase/beta-hexosaminidase C-terminal domain-containing protein [Pirellulimonas nuda]QDU88931.1 CotH protein [Pirellulimonas nuda]
MKALTGRQRIRVFQFERLEERRVLAADLVISEFLASNSGGLKDGDGDSSDWVEVLNAGDTAADLGGYYLTDDSTNLTKWAFPAGTTLGPGAMLIVFASDKGANGPAGELHTPYKLSAGGEYLGLIDPDGQSVVHAFAPEFPSQETNISYGLSMTSSEEQVLVGSTAAMSYWVPTSGVVDSTWTQLAFDDSGWAVGTPGIGYENNLGSDSSYDPLINAPVPSGTTTAYTRFSFNLTDLSQISSLSLEMIYDDGFAAYLNGELVESENAPATLNFQSFVSSNLERPDGEVLDAYVRFDLSAFTDRLVVGENVLAIHALNQASSSDMLMIPRLVASGSALVRPLIEGYFAQPTPGTANPESLLGIVADTKFSVDRGFFDAPFVVEITTQTQGATIVYTTDGSAPAVDSNLNVVNGVLYNPASPVTITGTTNLRAAAFKLGHAPTNVDTQTYLFTSDIIGQTYQSAIDAGLPASWGSRSADYGLDPDVIGPGDLFGGVYASQIEDSLKAIPTISLTLDDADFFGPNGIYANVGGRGVDWERATSAELIFSDGSEGFQIDAGLRIHGAASRNLSKKNALRLLFKSEYGDTKLNFPLFGETGVDKFDTIVLRPHFNDGWGWGGAGGDPLFIRDQWFRDTQAAMGHASARGNVVHLYVNGLYWGLYNPSERPDVSFAAETFGGEKEEYDAVNHNGLHGGSIAAYNQMIDVTTDVARGSTQATKNVAYQQLQGKLPNGAVDPNQEVLLEVTNYIDYMILNHYGGNDDWPNRNWYANRRRGPESEGFRFFAWDSEISLALSTRTDVNESYIGANTGAAEAYGNLVSSDEFRIAFADRVHKHLFNAGALYVDPSSPSYDPQNPQGNVPASRFADLSETVFDAMVAESARWGDQHVTVPRTRDLEWQQQLDYMLGVYFRDRHGIVLDQWRSAGLYPDTGAPEFLVDSVRQHGGELDSAAVVTFENPNAAVQGTIYYTTDGTDPRLIGGSVNSASASVFAGAVQLPGGETTVKARILRDGQWSALTDATFSVPLAENADFNGDGFVDSADYTVWRDNLGVSGGAGLQGDANYDGVVDSGDYQVWRAQFGSAAAVALPAFGSQAAPASVLGVTSPVGDEAPSTQAFAGLLGLQLPSEALRHVRSSPVQGPPRPMEREALDPAQVAGQQVGSVASSADSTSLIASIDRQAVDEAIAAWGEESFNEISSDVVAGEVWGESRLSYSRRAGRGTRT